MELENHGLYQNKPFKTLLSGAFNICGKYRKKLLNRCGYDIKYIFNEISEKQNVNILEMEIDKDHIHLLVQYNPTQSMLEIIRSIKQISTYRIWRSEHRDFLKRHFWKERTFWSDGYFVGSIGQVSEETIRKYIQEQG